MLIFYNKTMKTKQEEVCEMLIYSNDFFRLSELRDFYKTDWLFVDIPIITLS